MLALILAGSGAGVGLWYTFVSHEDNALDTTGFDMSQSPQDVASPLAAAASPLRPRSAPVPSTGLSMIKSEPGLRFGSGGAAAGSAAKPGGPQDLNDIARRSGGPVSAFTKRFRDQHPVMRLYSKQWLSYPDLKKLNDDYLKDHDLIKFVHGLERSPNFGPLVRRIALDPASHQLATDFISGVAKAAPAELVSSASALLKADHGVMGLAKGVFSAMGAPPMLLSALSGGDLDTKDVEQRVNSVTAQTRRR